jgi:hypothetical protein
MNCPMRLGLFDTTCPQRLREQNPVKVVFCPLRLRTSRSSSHKSPLFLLMILTCLETYSDAKKRTLGLTQ